MRILNVNLADQAYPIFIEADSLARSASEIFRHCDARTYLVITDDNVAVHYLDEVKEALTGEGSRCLAYKIPPGEASKSFTVAEQMYTYLLANRIHRDDVIVALGGGVVGDIAGFVAATYLRGIRWVQIPTTLIAQVDSSVGGKVGVNHPLAKNSIGAFYQPQLVWIDPMTLKTLPQREIYSGMAEVLKYGLILDEEFFEFLETNFDNILSLVNSDFLIHVIRNCCRLKARVVEQDERENDYRRILNFGHTIGHALEQLTEYNYFRHGEAIAYGMLAAAEISRHKINFPSDLLQRAEALIDKIEKPAIPGTISREQILEAIKNDKKITARGLQFVLLERIGSAQIQAIDPELVHVGLDRLLLLK